MVSNLEDSNKFNSLSFTYTFILSGKFDNKSLTPENDLNMNILSESAKISFEVTDFLVQGNIIDDKFVNWRSDSYFSDRLRPQFGLNMIRMRDKFFIW